MTGAAPARTGPGRRSPLPSQVYQLSPAVKSGEGGLEVVFEGDDGRRGVFRFASLPLVSWHEPVAAAFASRIGPGGGLRTLASAQSLWDITARFVRFVASQQPRPTVPASLRAAHLDLFRSARAAAAGQPAGLRELRQVLALLGQEPLRGLLTLEVADYLGRRWADPRRPGRPGYSDGELARILAAARSDTAAISGRIEAARQLLSSYERGPGALTTAERALARQLAPIAATGIVPAGGTSAARRRLAAHLFLTRQDLPPLLILMVTLTGRNGETVKELPAAHTLLDSKAVEVTVIKRRRGPGHWIGQVAWETGSPSRRLHTPGGCYLLIWDLAARGREVTGSASLWSVWRNGHGGVSGTAEHHDPFAGRLGDLLPLNAWARRHGLLGDDGNPLSMRLGRLRTSAEVRRTRQLGGHLPSAARTNTMQVLWGSYLRADPAVMAWAEETLSAALGDAERAALDAHARALAGHGTTLRVIPGPPPGAAGAVGLDAATARRVVAGELDTAWAACTGREASPWNAGTCRASFLDCFHCGNCLITTAHLPRLLALATALEQRREQINASEWWQRYGPAWAAIRHHVLPEFTPAEIQAATVDMPGDSLLDLAEGIREQP